MNQKMYAVNETVKSYEPGSQERHDIQKKYDEMANQSIDIPIIINGKEYRTEEIGQCIMPHDHQNIIARYHKAGEKEVELAINSALKVWKIWSRTCLLYTSPSPRDRG